MNQRQKVINFAITEKGNQGGKKYWSWWGYKSRVAWCQIFVSYVMEKCGVDYGHYENCQYAIGEAKKKGRWRDRNTPAQPGYVIYYDWNNDGVADHVGIVTSVVDGFYVVTEGNKNDRVENRTIAKNNGSITGFWDVDYKEVDSVIKYLPKQKGCYQVTASSLNLRKGPGTGFDIVDELAKGEFVHAFGYWSGNWCLCLAVSSGVIGWCSKAYLAKYRE